MMNHKSDSDDQTLSESILQVSESTLANFKFTESRVKFKPAWH
jgi:hypothetical protein